MKNLLIVLVSLFFLSGCNKQQERAMKSADKDYILKVANENFEKKKWRNALALYERLSNLVAGTDDAPNVVYNSAYANYYDKNYKLAGHQFKNFAVTFPQDKRAEDAAYMSALCYYQGSMDYNLDQSSTELAINELQNFLNNYPNSEKAKNINELIDELTYKLEFKAYENARQYYKMADYRAANVAFDNVLQDFPSTKLRPKIYEYILKSRYELAVNSVYDLKKDRIENALAFTRQVEREMPNTDNAKTALDLRSKLEKEKTDFAELEKKVEARKQELLNKQKEAEAEQNAAKEKEIAEQLKRDSIKLATP
ncbi:outer membrane protein assembly factor BamD [Chryseobacterium suipulveris]|uniref:Outer membrane protein assembly factor BamD n=1 Tax=Chryseobacterium suipulveris TaxID=2929800 RepID=A0ABY4BPX5_9FLAO|nr:outer membrane protein assembly factor BamD [Chryseobacterium suipulveris]UOE41258.1 outer membrane protein assembly factor BamD [Chryseobacterium suipulveris]